MSILSIRTLGAVAALALSAAFIAGTGSMAQATDDAYCDQRAHDYASRHTRGKGTVGGALVGGTFGAIVGKVLGGNKGAGVGALVGGTTGAVVGTDHEDKRYAALYDQAYQDCLERAGYREQPVYAEGPEPWTNEWYEYCSAKYRSFNAETGEFMSYSGEYKFCR